MLLQFESNDQLLTVTYLNNGASFPFRCDPSRMRCERITHPTGGPGIETPATFEFLADGSIVAVEEPQVRIYRRVMDCPAR